MCMLNREIISIGSKLIGLYVISQYVRYLGLVAARQIAGSPPALLIMTLFYLGSAIMMIFGSRLIACVTCREGSAFEVASTISLRDLLSAALSLLGVFTCLQAIPGLIQRVQTNALLPPHRQQPASFMIAQLVLGVLLFVRASGFASLWLKLNGRDGFTRND